MTDLGRGFPPAMLYGGERCGLFNPPRGRIQTDTVSRGDSAAERPHTCRKALARPCVPASATRALGREVKPSLRKGRTPEPLTRGLYVMTHDEAVAEITRRCYALGVYVLLHDKEILDTGDGAPSVGLFDDEHLYPVLGVATKRDKKAWLQTLLHEYGHVTQWAENSPLWIDCQKHGSWTDWIQGKQVRDIKGSLIASREVEADCERRTIRLIKELDLDIDLEEYARAANAYVHFYNFMLINRQWFAKDKAPYKVPEVMAVANPTMDTDFSKTPKALMKALELCVEPKNNNKKAKG